MEYLKNNNLVINDLLPIISNYLSPTKEEWKGKFKIVVKEIEKELCNFENTIMGNEIINIKSFYDTYNYFLYKRNGHFPWK